ALPGLQGDGEPRSHLAGPPPDGPRLAGHPVRHEGPAGGPVRRGGRDPPGGALRLRAGDVRGPAPAGLARGQRPSGGARALPLQLDDARRAADLRRGPAGVATPPRPAPRGGAGSLAALMDLLYRWTHAWAADPK